MPIVAKDTREESVGRGPLAPSGETLVDPLGVDALGADPLAAENPGTEPAEEERGGWLARAWQQAKEGASSAWEGVKEAGSSVAQSVGEGASAAWEGAKSVGRTVKGGVEEGAAQAWEGAKTAGRAVKSGAVATWEGAKKVGTGAKEGATQGAVIGAGLGLGAGAALGGTAGAGAGLMGGKGGMKGGAALGGGVLGLAGGLAGGVLGALAGPVVRGIDELRTDEKELLLKTASIPAYHVLLEQFAHHYAYGRGDPAQLEAWDYEISKEHEDTNSGFRVVAFSPRAADAVGMDGQSLRPVVAFRGTANAEGVQDDANTQGVGTFQFSRNEKEIEGVIGAAQGASKPDVTGHSLGGALAQLAAARFGSMVGDVVTFQSPGIAAAEAMRIDAEKHKATHYRAKGDLVSDAGEAYAPGELFTFEHKGPNSPLSHLSFPLAELNALRQKHDMDVPIVSGTRSDDDEWVIEGGHHEGHWEGEDPQVKSRLMDVRHHEDVQEGPTTGITDVLSLGGGRGVSEPVRAMAGAMTGISDRQSNYATAWRAIRAVCRTVQKPEQVPGVRAQVVDLCIEHKVDPKDHAKFISQAEAAMLTALEQSPFNVGPPLAV